MFRSTLFNKNRKQTLQFGIYVVLSLKKKCFSRKSEKAWLRANDHVFENRIQLSFTCSRSTVETVEKEVRYVQS